MDAELGNFENMMKIEINLKDLFPPFLARVSLKYLVLPGCIYS